MSSERMMSLTEEGDVEDLGGTRAEEGGEDVEVRAGDFVETVGFAVVDYVVVEEGAEVGSAEMQASVERGLNDDIERPLGGEQQAGLDEEAEMRFVL